MNGSEWSEVSVAWLRTMVHNRILYARFYPTGPKVTVELYLERGRLGTVRYLSLKREEAAHKPDFSNLFDIKQTIDGSFFMFVSNPTKTDRALPSLGDPCLHHYI